MSQNDEDVRFEALEQVLMGRPVGPQEGGVDIGNTCLSPAILALEFVIKDSTANRHFKQWLHQNKLFPTAIEGIDLPDDALERDLKLAINGLLVFEQAAKFIQDQVGAQGEQAGQHPRI